MACLATFRVNVYNDHDEKIGDIVDVLLNPQGQVEGVVIGVGGFLGIGQHDVAVPFSELQWQMTDRNDTSGTNRPTVPSTTTTAPATGTATTGSTNRMADGHTGANRDHPARAVLPGASKDQLKNAPEYRAGK